MCVRKVEAKRQTDAYTHVLVTIKQQTQLSHSSAQQHSVTKIRRIITKHRSLIIQRTHLCKPQALPSNAFIHDTTGVGQ